MNDETPEDQILDPVFEALEKILEENDNADGPERIVTGMLKWYDQSRGFGFVKVFEQPDHFLYFEPMGDRGIESLEDGCVIVGAVGTNISQGPVINEIIAIVFPKNEPWKLEVPYGEPTDWVMTQVKIPIMKSRGGFGFLRNPDGGDDIFLLHGIVTNAGIVELAPDQVIEVKYAIREDNGKPIAVAIRHPQI